MLRDPEDLGYASIELAHSPKDTSFMCFFLPMLAALRQNDLDWLTVDPRPQESSAIYGKADAKRLHVLLLSIDHR